MKKKIFIIIILCIIAVIIFKGGGSFLQGKYKLEDLKNADESYLKAADYFLEKNFKYARTYPPKIKSQKQRLTIRKELTAVIVALSLRLEKEKDNTELLWRLGYAHTMGYNLDWPYSKVKHDINHKPIS